MGKIFHISLIVFLLVCAPVFADNYYFDLAGGNDTTGDGSSGSPWKTVDKCTTSRSAGDECRGAKTTITTLSGTLTFTNGSATVNTSEDLTAVVAAGDMVGKNAGVDTWWHVASSAASTITLTNQYWAPTGSGDAVTGYKITPVAAPEKLDINSSGNSGANLKISGGWDLTGPTQDGWTCFSAYSTGIGIEISGDSHVEISKFIIYASGNNAINIASGSYSYLHDLHLSGGGSIYPALQISGPFSKVKDTYINSAVYHGLVITSSLNEFENLYVYSSGNASNEYGVSLTGYANFFKNLRIYNSYDDNLNISSDGGFNLFTDCIFSTNRNASSYSVVLGQSENRFYNCTLSGSTSYDISVPAAIITNFFINCTLSGTTGDYTAISATSESPTIPALVIAPSGADPQRIFARGIIESNTADARSGKCVKIMPKSSTVPIGEKVGSVKVTSEASDLTVSAYLKNDASFDGTVWYLVLQNGQFISRTVKIPTTSYVKESVVFPLASLVEGSYIDLWVFATGTTGAAYVDDFSAEQ